MNKTGRKRDDFSQAVKEDLAKRVNYHCSICDAPTNGPKRGTKKTFSIGKAAHIKAAAQNGPRYDPLQSPAERAAFENGLWACASCADIIDRNEAAYSVEQLQKLKEDAERLAEGRLGRISTSLATAVPTQRSISRAIQTFCLTEAARYEAMDPRFNVSVDWRGGDPVYEFRANEPVLGHLAVYGDALPRIGGVQDVLDYGGSITFKHGEFQLEGSPIFAEYEDVQNGLSIASKAIDIVLTFVLGAETEGAAVFLDFDGKGTIGKKGFRFTGEALKGLARVTLTIDHETQKRQFDLAFDVSQWCGRSLSKLPNYGRMAQFAKQLVAGTPFSLRFSLNDVESSVGSGAVKANEYFRKFGAFISRIELFRKINDFFQIGLTLPSNSADGRTDQNDVLRALSIIEVSKAEVQEITATVEVPDSLEVLTEFIGDGHARPIEFTESVSFSFFGRVYGPFNIEVSCQNAIVIVPAPMRVLPGKSVSLVLKAAEGCYWTSRLKQNAATRLSEE